MKKKDFVTLIMSTVGGILFALGMCMALLPEWGAMAPGVVVGGAGAVILLAMLMVRRKMSGKPAVVFNAKAIGITLLGVAGAIVLGRGHVYDDGLVDDDSRYPGWYYRHRGPCFASFL